jgi:glycosyltransferase involved in cell wall biosynthesis
MKVLVSAIACHPHLGSESKVGWDAARAISEIPMVQECHVMTHTVNREAIVKEQTSGHAPRVRFHFFGEPFRYHPNRMLARLQSWLIYWDWQRLAVARATELHRRYAYSLTHHVTYASWRVPPRLWQMPLPFVFGPVGGGAKTTKAFRPMLGHSARAFEFLRDATTVLSTRFSGLEECCRRATAVLAADSSTAVFLAQHGAKDVRQLCQVFFREAESSRLEVLQSRHLAAHDALRIFAGGNLEGRKGTLLALHALALLKKKGVPFSYTYGTWGPDLNAMTKLAHHLGIANQVTFHEGFKGEDYRRQLAHSNVYLLPSIRETAGITMMEAMLAGCYPIVLAGTGAGDIVESAGVQTICATTINDAVEKIAELLEWCHNHREEMLNSAQVAGSKIRGIYSEQAYQKSISEVYTAATESPARHL